MIIIIIIASHENEFDSAIVVPVKKIGWLWMLLLLFSGTSIHDLNCTALYWPGMPVVATVLPASIHSSSTASPLSGVCGVQKY